MTEINIKRKRSALPWILLGIAIVAVLVYFLAFYNKKEQVEQPTPAPELISVQENNTTVAAYVNFISSSDNKMSLDHAFTNEALLKLTSATNAMADEVGYDVKADLEKAKEYANKITNDPFETSHADNIRKAADMIAVALQNIQMAKYPMLAKYAVEVKVAAEAINPDTLTLDQRDAVKTFFAKAANLLQKMN